MRNYVRLQHYYAMRIFGAYLRSNAISLQIISVHAKFRMSTDLKSLISKCECLYESLVCLILCSSLGFGLSPPCSKKFITQIIGAHD